MKKIVLGCGYLGSRVAREYLRQGLDVTGVVRSAESAEGLRRQGLSPLLLDLDETVQGGVSVAGDGLFYFVPPPKTGVEDTRVGHLLSSFGRENSPRRIVYLGTTGVYGDCGGDWVDEDRPVRPVVERALRRWDAEERFRAWSRETGGELVILRVAGIYGPDKLPLARLRKGVPMVRESEAPFTNRIHIDDLVQVCIAAMERGRAGEIYNVCDGHPGNMTDYFNRVADWAGLPRPAQIPLGEAEGRLSAGILSYMRESRRLSNRKMLEGLDIELQFATLQEGLRACGKPSP